MYVNKNDKDGKCAIQGNTAEVAFKKLLSKEGQVLDADITEQRNHVDLILIKNGKKIRYEVKARKRVSRGDSGVQDELVWIELINVAGNVGWVNGGSDFVGFERENDFAVVSRAKLLTLVTKLCNPYKRVKSPEEALYKGYQRYGRQDLLTLIKMSDLESIIDRTILKD